MQDEVVGGWDVRIERRMLKNNSVKYQHPPAAFFFSSLSLPFFPSPSLSLHLVWSVWSWSALMPNWDKCLKHTHTQKKTGVRKRWEEVWRGDCWSEGADEGVLECSLLLCATFQTLIALRGQFTFHSLSQQVGEMGVRDRGREKMMFQGGN